MTMIMAGADSSCLLTKTKTKSKDHPQFWFTNKAAKSYSNSRVVSITTIASYFSWRLKANSSNVAILHNTHSQSRIGVEIPVTCYQIVGVPDKAEKDEIVKSVMDLKSSEIEEGYTMDVVVSRQDLLMDVRDKLLFEPEYAGNTREKIPPKSSLRIPCAWLPGALCLLQEVGEEQLVLDIGREALQLSDAKPYIHDLLLSMALAECAIAKIGFEKNKVSQGFEALARAQCLLRSKKSLAHMPLLSQIEESLEELAPACTLELLGMPNTPDNGERRRGAIAALRELLRQGLDVETSCQVQDWSCFLNQAIGKLMAAEIVDLLPWDSLAVTRKNKKSLESQNQRVIIDFSSFYIVLIAHVALGFSSKQTDLINRAKTMSECLVAAENIDLKFEEALCSFLLGQGDESDVIDKLQHLELNSNPGSRNSVSVKGIIDGPSAKPSLEGWLKGAVLGLFPDTRDCSPSLANFFGGEKKALGSRPKKGGATQDMTSLSHRPLSNAIVSSDGRGFEEPRQFTNPSRHLGPAVKQLTPSNLQSPLTEGVKNNSSASNVSGAPSVQLKRSLGAYHYKIWESWLSPRDVAGRIASITVLGCVVFSVFVLKGRIRWASNKQLYTDPSLLTSTLDSHLNHNGRRPACIDTDDSIAGRIKNFLGFFKLQSRNIPSEAGNLQNLCLAASLSSSMTAVYKRPMPLEEAEALVRQWQTTKAEALGPSHQLHSLSQVLDEQMLAQWEALGGAAKERSCFWRFVLLQLSVLRAEILSDGIGAEMAEIEAFLEEAAELIDDSQPKNPNYYSTYKIRYVLKRHDDGLWRFCEGDIQTPS